MTPVGTLVMRRKRPKLGGRTHITSSSKVSSVPPWTTVNKTGTVVGWSMSVGVSGYFDPLLPRGGFS